MGGGGLRSELVMPQCLTTSSRPTVYGLPTFPGFSPSAPWLWTHLSIGLRFPCSLLLMYTWSLGSPPSLLTLWRNLQWPLLLLLVCDLSQDPGSACYSLTCADCWKGAHSVARGKAHPRSRSWCTMRKIFLVVRAIQRWDVLLVVVAIPFVTRGIPIWLSDD